MIKKRKVANEAIVKTALTEQQILEKKLQTRLEEISKYNSIKGYIIRKPTSAKINFKNTTHIIDYAIISSSVYDISSEFSEHFDLGNINNIVIEGKNAKVISLNISENKLSIFMEKNADCEKILRRFKTIKGL